MTRPDDDRLRDEIGRLPREHAPERDLWPGITERIQQASPRARTQRRAAAAAASSLAFAAIAALVVGLRGQGSVPSSVASVDPSPRPSSPAPRAELPGEADYEGAERMLATELADRRASLPPEEATVIDKNLRIVDDAIASTREALRKDPEDDELRAELDRAWDDKIDLLERATELPGEK